VLRSALLSVAGESNPINLPKAHSVCVLLIDGLGVANLRAASAHASFLNSQKVEKISCYFPSTTSTSLTSFATGLAPNETGFIGYQIHDRRQNKSMNLLSGWTDQESALTFQPKPTISEQAIALGYEFHVVSQDTYRDTGLTAATMRGVEFHGEQLIENRLSKAIDLLNGDSKKVIYLYIPELDQIAHNNGVNSNRWLNSLEELDALLRAQIGRIRSNRGLVLTADHGILDVQEENKIYLDDYISENEVEFVGGDTRGLMFYFKDQAKTADYGQYLNEALGDRCYVFGPEKLVEAGYLEDLGDRPELLPDLWLVARKQVALYHTSFARKKSLANIGHHGGFTDEELSVPLITFGF